MKQKIVIGKKITKVDVIKSFVITNIYALILVVVLTGMIFPAFNIKQEIKIVLIILLFIIVWIFIIPVIGSTQRLEVSNESIKYYHVKGMWNQFKEIIHVFNNREEKPIFNIPLNQIKNTTISYRLTLGGYGLKGYTIVLTFLLKDYSVVRFVPFNTINGENKLYLDILKCLQENGIMIIDQYKLMDKLNLSNQEMLNYINEIEDRK